MNKQDQIQGFVINGSTPYWSYLHQANGAYLTVKARYTELLMKLKADGVAFKDIKNRLLNCAKEEGLYTEAIGPWCSSDGTGSLIPSFRPYNELVKAGVAWAVCLSLFLGWVSRNYEDYNTKKDQSATAPKPKTRQVWKVLNPITGVLEERKVTISGVTDEEYESWVTSMRRPVEAEMDLDQVEMVLQHNPELLTTLYGNIAEEKGAIPEYNAFVTRIGKPNQVIVQ